MHLQPFQDAASGCERAMRGAGSPMAEPGVGQPTLRGRTGSVLAGRKVPPGPAFPPSPAAQGKVTLRGLNLQVRKGGFLRGAGTVHLKRVKK